ncbi:TetR/AcrR family transcriptional regulator [Mycolicibacterium pulveris]|uniref:TetR family transcriptional regulator n=1 Tax=Mycolicibacterium pulveris TaxID=36813 RepID=A0A7I7UDB8_MYCPV|nr:ScbR family autoregulator-binding transcription factor [Mycolicibacterium pulveris]MCV6983889.1 TetR/AcrR family transcriptional regulator [Mycolicibacterium pulveris]BBY79448.1 TetR family transcriptional regulator [Mycolicibacterium pulveris]
MVRQARSEATRRRIITSAVHLFNEIGYDATGLGDIIEHAEMTKGALYYHFDSKQSLANAIIEEGNANLLHAFNSISESSAPALERIIHGVFVAVDLLSTDRVARSGLHLLQALGESNSVAAQHYGAWIHNMTLGLREAIEEGDLRPDLDTRALGETLVGAVLGIEVLSSAMSSGADVSDRLTRMWELLLPVIVTDESLPYFRAFLARQSMRHSGQDSG